MASMPQLTTPLAKLESVDVYTEGKAISARGPTSTNSRSKREGRSRSKTALDRKTAHAVGLDETPKKRTKKEASEKKTRSRSKNGTSPENTSVLASADHISSVDSTILASMVLEPCPVLSPRKPVFSLPPPSPPPNRDHSLAALSKAPFIPLPTPKRAELRMMSAELSRSLDFTSSMTSTEDPLPPSDYFSMSDSCSAAIDPTLPLPHHPSILPVKSRLSFSSSSGAGQLAEVSKENPSQSNSSVSKKSHRSSPKIGEKTVRVSQSSTRGTVSDTDSPLRKSALSDTDSPRKIPRKRHNKDQLLELSPLTPPKNWNVQIETDLLQMEVRIRQMRVDEADLDLSIAKKKAELHELQLEAQRRAELGSVLAAIATELAEHPNILTPTIATSTAKAQRPTASSIWRSSGSPTTTNSSSSPFSSRSPSPKPPSPASLKKLSSTSSKKKLLKKMKTSADLQARSGSPTSAVSAKHSRSPKSKHTATEKNPKKSKSTEAPTTVSVTPRSKKVLSIVVSAPIAAPAPVSSSTEPKKSNSLALTRKKEEDPAINATPPQKSASKMPPRSKSVSSIPKMKVFRSPNEVVLRVTGDKPGADSSTVATNPSTTSHQSVPPQVESTLSDVASSPVSDSIVLARRPYSSPRGLHSLPAPSLRSGLLFDSPDGVPLSHFRIPPV